MGPFSEETGLETTDKLQNWCCASTFSTLQSINNMSLKSFAQCLTCVHALVSICGVSGAPHLACDTNGAFDPEENAVEPEVVQES